MKIVHISDVHGDLRMLERASRLVQKASNADVIAITGDIAGSVLEGDELDYFVGVSQDIQNLRNFLYQNTEGKIDTTRKAAEALAEGIPELNVENEEETKKHARNYLDLEDKTKQGLRAQYQGVKDILDSMPQTKVLVPGNWDCHCMDDYLSQYNIHNRDKQVIVDGVNFVGYGGKGAQGSFALKAYVNLRQPDAVLQGHSHKAEIAMDKHTDTLISTPGNLGQYGNSPGGTFAELEYNPETGIIAPVRAWTIKSDNEAQPYSFEKQAS